MHIRSSYQCYSFSQILTVCLSTNLKFFKIMLVINSGAHFSILFKSVEKFIVLLNHLNFKLYFKEFSIRK